MSSHIVTDYYHVLQCYRCQSFGHKSSSCSLANTGELFGFTDKALAQKYF